MELTCYWNFAFGWFFGLPAGSFWTLSPEGQGLPLWLLPTHWSLQRAHLRPSHSLWTSFSTFVRLLFAQHSKINFATSLEHSKCPNSKTTSARSGLFNNLHSNLLATCQIWLPNTWNVGTVDEKLNFKAYLSLTVYDKWLPYRTVQGDTVPSTPDTKRSKQLSEVSITLL